jgi:3-hydroxyisobutyrate dehydrogenase
VAAAARAGGAHVVDCGVSGGPSAAATGDLICMVGGEDADIDRAMPALDAIGSLVVRMGPLGSGLIAKLARNVIQYGSWLAAYEGQRICESAGIELSKLAQVVKASDERIGGPSTLMFRPTVAPFGPEDHEGLVNHMRSAAALAHKDLQAALGAAAALGIELPGATLTDEYADAIFGVGEAPSA